MCRKFGFSFSWKRALGISSAKQKISRKTGIPLTKQGRQRKAGRIMTGGCCSLPVIVFIMLLSIILACGSGNGEITGSSSSTQKPTKTPMPTPTFTVYEHRDFITYPDNYKGARIKLTGEVFNILSDELMQIWAGASRDAVAIFSANPFEKIYEGDNVSVEGFVKGSECRKTTIGGMSCQPVIENAKIDKIENTGE